MLQFLAKGKSLLVFLHRWLVLHFKLHLIDKNINAKKTVKPILTSQLRFHLINTEDIKTNTYYASN